VLDEGRRRGHALAQLTILLGNAPAQRAYEKLGFKRAEERRHPDFEAAIGCPGLGRLTRDL
jgi:ribosomal protein S18 acetylase RimI-like enzyme